MAPNRLPTFLFSIFLGVPLAAQELVAGLPVEQTTPTERASALPSTTPDGRQMPVIPDARSGLGVLDGQLWGLGNDYRAGFVEGQAEFLPLLGEQAPRDFPFRLSLHSVGRGDTTVLERPEPVAPQQDGLRAFYAHQEGITERYDVRPEGLELSVVIDRPIGGRGDLVVSMATESELEGPFGEYFETLQLRASAYGFVDIGAVIGIDADGRRCAGWLRRSPGRLDMVLPESFVERAAFPLVVDPVIGNGTWSSRSFNDEDPDIAFDVQTGRWGMVFETAGSGVSRDIWLRLIEENGTLVNNVVPVSVGSVPGEDPAIGSVRQAVGGSQFVIAYNTRDPILQVLACRSVVASNGSVSPQKILASNTVGGGVGFHADVVGDPSQTAIDALVAWKVSGFGFNGLRACQVTPAGASRAPNALDYTDLTSDSIASNVKISESGGSTHLRLFCWQTRVNGRDHVAYRVLDRDLNSTDPTVRMINNPFGGTNGGEIERPHSAGDGADTLLTFQLVHPTHGRQIYGVHLDISAPGWPLQTGVFRISDVPAPATEPATCYFGDGVYGVAWCQPFQNVASNFRTIGGVNVRVGEAQTCGRQWEVSRGSNHGAFGDLACASVWEGGGSGDRGMFAFDSQDTSGNVLIATYRFEALGSGGSIQDLGGGCGIGGTASSSGGPLALGNSGFQLELSGALRGSSFPNGCALSLAVGRNPQVFQCPGGCDVLIPVVSVPLSLTFGSTSYPFPVQCHATLFGAVFQAQFLVLSPTEQPCLNIPVSASNRLQLTIGD